MAEDQDILAALDRRFADLTERLDERFERIDERFERIDERFERIDQRFERVEGEIRHAHVKIEAQSGEIRQLAEGVASVDHKLEQFRVDVARRFDETHSLLRLSHGDLDQRVSTLERGHRDLDSRVTALEGDRH